MKNKATQILWWTSFLNIKPARDDIFLPKQANGILQQVIGMKGWHTGEDQYDRAARATKLIKQWWQNGVTCMNQITGENGNPLRRKTLHPFTPTKDSYEEITTALWPHRAAQGEGDARTSAHTLINFLRPHTTPYDLTPCHMTNRPETIECQEDEYQARCIRGERTTNETTYYHIEWDCKGRPKTWEPAENILHPSLIQQWHSRKEW
jgi:hypothetical protein